MSWWPAGWGLRFPATSKGVEHRSLRGTCPAATALDESCQRKRNGTVDSTGIPELACSHAHVTVAEPVAAAIWCAVARSMPALVEQTGVDLPVSAMSFGSKWKGVHW
jgi:hypothetical protein